jgi:hypothetical protein
MVGNGIILFRQWEVLHVLRSLDDADEIEWEGYSGHVWSGIAGGVCRKYGIGRILRS